MLNEKLTVNFEAIFVPSRQASIQASSSVIPLKKIKTSNITEFTMLQPDSVYVLKAHDPVHSVHFQNQQLLVGTKAGRVKIFCLSVSCFCLHFRNLRNCVLPFMYVFRCQFLVVAIEL